METPLENPAKMDDLGVPSFQKTPRYVPKTWGDCRVSTIIQYSWLENFSTKTGEQYHAQWTGVGIDVPTIGDWFHITKTNICWRWNIPIVGWCETLGHRNQPLNETPPFYGPIGFIWGGWKAGDYSSHGFRRSSAAWPSGLQASSLAVMVWFSESPCVGNLAWGVMGPHE